MAAKRVIIIGAGNIGKSLIELFHHDSTIELLGVADVNKNAPGFLLAKKYGIFATQNFAELLKFPFVSHQYFCNKFAAAPRTVRGFAAFGGLFLKTGLCQNK